MRKEIWIAGGLGITMLLVIGGIGFVIWRASNTSNTTKQSVKSVQSTVDTSDSSLGISDGSGQGLGNGVNLGGLEGSSSVGQSQSKTAPSSSSNQKQNFTEYEKYSKQKSALFGEIVKGTGAEVNGKNKVAIYYIGYLTNGTIFDNQWPAKEGDKPKPFEFTIGTNTIIAGLQQGVFGMKVGGKRRIIIPPAAGYGDKGQGSIPPDSVLIFDVELLSVK